MKPIPSSLRRPFALTGALMCCLAGFTLASGSAKLNDANDLEAFLDGVMTAHLESHHIPGAAIAVVKDGQVLLTKGYGFANLETRRPVNPERTLFRIASVTKLFTWTAAMQLAERGKLNLNADVNTYLHGFRVPATYPEPITMLHLMAHNAGFEERAVGQLARNPEEMLTPQELLAQGLPARVRPPGRHSSYSNHGATLAGLVVSEIAGMPWEDYIQKHLLEPLVMRHSTARQPVPTEFAAQLSRGYEYRDGEYVPGGFEYIQTAPGGAISATASDMAHFMLAHLQLGQYGQARILNLATAREMQQTHFRHDPRVRGMAHGFIEGQTHGLRLIGHGGDTALFHSGLWLIPKERLGLFVVYNGAGGSEARAKFLRAFLERYYPVPWHAPQPARADADATRLGGQYGLNRVAHTTIDRLGGLLNVMPVRAGRDGTLALQGGPTYIETAPLEFHERGGEGSLVFAQDGTMFIGDEPTIAARRLKWYETPNFNLALVGVSLLMFLMAAFVWPIRNVLRRKTTHLERGARVTLWVAGLTSLAFLVFLVALGIGLRNPMVLAFGVPALVRWALNVGLLATGLSVPVIACAILVWRKAYFNRVGRVQYSLLALATLVTVWFMNFWNILGHRY